MSMYNSQENKGILSNTSAYAKLGGLVEAGRLGGPADMVVKANTVKGAYLVPTTSPASYDVLVLSNSGREHATLEDAYGDCAVQYAEYQCQK